MIATLSVLSITLKKEISRMVLLGLKHYKSLIGVSGIENPVLGRFWNPSVRFNIRINVNFSAE